MACGKEKQNRKADTKNMSDKVLEVNVDDLYLGGVFSLVKNVVKNTKQIIRLRIVYLSKDDLRHFNWYGCLYEQAGNMNQLSEVLK